VSTPELWAYGPEWADLDLVGFSVEATDGQIGKVDEKSDEVGADYIVVDTGPWIFGKRVMLPAGTISSVDVEERSIFVARTKEQIKDAPEFDRMTYRDTAYRDKLGGYYGPGL
jgi:hypothetical protein